MYSVILCGGSGTRLWPLSRKNLPKQFLKLYGDKSLLQHTFNRAQKIMPLEHIFIIVNNEHYFNALDQIKEIAKEFKPENIIIEPASLNTAPAITLAVKYLTEVAKVSLDEPIIVLPADHYITEEDHFAHLITMATVILKDNWGTIGIEPTTPETGYGYIKKGHHHGAYFEVAEFKEKPTVEVAMEYVSSHEYLWNSGIYLFSLNSFVRELYAHAPQLYQTLVLGYQEFLEKFSSLPNISIDNAVSEKSQNMVVFPGNFAWSDLGSFDNLAEVNSQVVDNNTQHLNVNSENIYIHSAKNRLIATVGVKDLIIIDSNDSLLIQQRGHSGEMRQVVDILKQRQMKELEQSLLVYRSWGNYEILIAQPGYSVRKITLYPDKAFGLQAHWHRSEHWVIIKGTGLAFKDGQESFLKENESIFIPPLAKHYLKNVGRINLEIIEIQTGSYLGEDDIVRFEK